MRPVVRIPGAVLLFVGLVLGVVGLFNGCNGLFTWNGRHPISMTPLAAEGPTKSAFVPEAGVRYTVAVQVVFDRAAAVRKDETDTVAGHMPLVVAVKDGHDTSLAKTSGWLDPNEPPNVLYGASAKESRRMPELVVERLVGPFMAASVAPLDVTIDLGADQAGGTPITERRMAIYDDKIPPSIKGFLVAGGVGVVLFLAGVVVSLVGFFRRKKKKRLIRA